MIFYNIHNYEISNAAIKRVSTRILSDLYLAKASPSKTILVVMGDFNFAAVGKLKLTKPLFQSQLGAFRIAQSIGTQ
eukprot:537783-Pyramimonas_sp.AAC.1